MDQDGSALQRQQQILAPPSQLQDALAADLMLGVRGHRPAEAVLPHQQAVDVGPAQMGGDPAQGGLYLRQLGHVGPIPLSAKQMGNW